MKKFLFLLCLSIGLSMAVGSEVSAQCPMCKMSAESNLKNGGSVGRGLNAGILYLLATPYLLVGGLGYLWWRNYKRERIQS